MGHLLKWVTLAGITALGDFQMVGGVLSEDQLLHNLHNRTLGCCRKKLGEIQKKWSLLKVTM